MNVGTTSVWMQRMRPCGQLRERERQSLAERGRHFFFILHDQEPHGRHRIHSAPSRA
jgi:hypothetical protein